MATGTAKFTIIDGLEKCKGTATIDGVEYMQLLVAAVEIGMYPNYLGKMCNDGSLAHVRDKRNRIWVSREALDEYKAMSAEAKAERKRAAGTRRAGAQLPARVRHVKYVLNMIAKAVESQDLAAADVASVVQFLEDTKDGWVVEWAAKQKAKEAEAEAASADPDFQSELE